MWKGEEMKGWMGQRWGDEGMKGEGIKEWTFLAQLDVSQPFPHRRQLFNFAQESRMKSSIDQTKKTERVEQKWRSWMKKSKKMKGDCLSLSKENRRWKFEELEVKELNEKNEKRLFTKPKKRVEWSERSWMKKKQKNER